MADQSIGDFYALTKEELSHFSHVLLCGIVRQQQALLGARDDDKRIRLAIQIEVADKCLKILEKRLEELGVYEAFNFPKEDNNDQAA